MGDQGTHPQGSTQTRGRNPGSIVAWTMGQRRALRLHVALSLPEEFHPARPKGFLAGIWDRFLAVTGLRKKSLWDLLQLIGIPLLLLWATTNINATVQKSQSDTEAERSRESAVQSYVDSMEDLLIKQNIGTDKQNEANAFALTKTILLLDQLKDDNARKSRVLVFLHMSNLIQSPDPNTPPSPVSVANAADYHLLGANLTNVTLPQGTSLNNDTLSYADMSGANLHTADLSNTYFVHTILNSADLEKVNLSSAHMSGSVLQHAHLTGANLSAVDMNSADLSGADLSSAVLTDADLSNANLSGVTVTTDQLNTAKSLQGATMPDGAVHQ